jgi:DNA invertase Pin-like site-specific DNA recombinase
VIAKTKVPKPTRAVGYVRISKKREDETSTVTQEERIRAYCTTRGWNVVDVVVEPGRSGYKTNRNSRPGFRRAKQMIEVGAADVLVVYKLNRVNRNTIDTLNLVQELAGHGAQFASVTEQIDTSSASGTMQLTMLAALAQLESDQKSEVMSEMQRHRRSTGMVPIGPTPFGYRRDPSERNVLSIYEPEAKVVRDVVARILDGASLYSVVAEGVIVNAKGRPYTHQGIAELLTSPTMVACRETKPGTFTESAEWEPILERKDWDGLRAMLSDPRRNVNPGNGRRWLLSGIATCGAEGEHRRRGLLVKSSPYGPRYFCTSCHLSIDVKATDELVEGDVLGALDVKTWRKLRRPRRTRSGRVVGVEDAVDELVAQWRAGDIDGAELDAKVAELERQEVTPPPVLPDVDNLRASWPKLDLEAKRLVLNAVTASLTVTPGVKGRRGFDPSRVEWVSSV